MEIIAHKKKNDIETLEEHKEKTKKYFHKILEIDLQEKELIEKSIIMHDEGKKGIGFREKIKNGKTDKYSEHSLPSAFYFLRDYIKNKNEKKINDLIIILTYLIAKHHGVLKEIKIKSFLNKNNINNNIFNINRIIKAIEKNRHLFEDITEEDINCLKNLTFDKNNLYFRKGEKDYFIIKLIFSMLIASDYYATFEFFNNKEINDFGRIKDIEKFFKDFNEKYNKLIEKKEKSEINKIRTELYYKALNKIKENKEKKIFFLNAPTGSGKTLLSINLVKELKPKKIVYCFPYNTIAEQTFKVFKDFGLDPKIFNSINSFEDFFKDIDENVEEKLLKIDMLHYPLIITSNVNLFNIIYSNKKKDIFPFWQLQNSVIIFDEIQSIPLKLIPAFIKSLNALTNVLNCKVIIMSATIPYRLMQDYLNENDTCILLGEETLQIPIFKNRNEIKKINEEFNNLEELFNFINKNIINNNDIKIKNKILIEFIFKKLAIDFFYLLKDKLKDYKILLITGDTSKLKRIEIINFLNNNNDKVIIISTQVIEAGIDIDVNIGLKQISTFENEMQFLGRINRNGKLKKGLAYFFSIKDKVENKIYRDEKGFSNLTIRDNKIFNILKNKNINYYYKLLKENFISKEENFVNFELKNYLSFEDIYKKMKIIDNNYMINVFIPYEINLDKFNVLEYKEYLIKKYNKFIINKLLDGKQVIEYLKDLKKENFIIKKKEFFNLKELLNLFTFNIPLNLINKKYDYFEKETYYGFFILKKEYINNVFDLENEIIDFKKEDNQLFL